MAYERCKSAREEKIGKYIYHFKSEIRTLDMKLERILMKF